jgi:hypothetical protein
MTRRDGPFATAPRLAATAAVAVGLAFGLGWQLHQPSSPSPDGGSTQPAIAALQDALAAERAARESLAADLAALRTELGELTARLGASAPAAETAASATPAPAPEPRAEATDTPRAPLFDAEVLVASCMHRSDVERLRARWERYELDKLELNNRAMRESFFMKPRHGEERSALDAAFRNDVGDDGFDAYLRATGRPNRVAVREVLPAGAGNLAGLEVGDELVEYAGGRVFSAADLQLLTASGRLGETVSVDVVRGGLPLTLRAARGPLGIVLDAVRRAPEAGC